MGELVKREHPKKSGGIVVESGAQKTRPWYKNNLKATFNRQQAVSQYTQ